MDTVKIKDKTFEIYISKQKIERTIKRLALEIETDMKDKDPLFLVILNGAFMFASDLFKDMSMPCEISFARLSSYEGTESTQQVKELIGVNDEIAGRHVIILEDIIDTGITLEHLQQALQKQNPASLRLATMLFKPKAFKKSYPVHYIGMEISNEFVVGYGLDYDGHGRNYANIYKVIE
ncbi:MAG: hypoxanthine phosphoribosyltransferase [Bacteroidales bacterium]|nr:hypoxanthine phosphoribosyltransferase [Bacteroidales bacterium]